MLFFLPYAFSQHLDSIPIKVRGPVATQYTADAEILQTVKTYLDSNFKMTDWPELEGKYILTQEAAYGWLAMPRCRTKKPDSVKLDSLMPVQSGFGHTIRHKRIIKGEIGYKYLFSYFGYRIENGYAIEMKKYNRRRTRLKASWDWSGLYTANKTWPVYTKYHRDGKVKRVHELYYQRKY